MSVIEQAAKRLEELRRAGAELNDNAPAASGADAATDAGDSDAHDGSAHLDGSRAAAEIRAGSA